MFTRVVSRRTSCSEISIAERERERHTDRERDKQRQTERDRHRQIYRQRHNQTYILRQIETKATEDRDRMTETDR